MQKKLPYIIIGIVVACIGGFIIWQMLHSVSREDLFEESCKTNCKGFSSYTADSDGYKVTSYTKGNPSTVVVINRYRDSLKAAKAFENRTVSTIGDIPDDGKIQYLSHGTSVYLVHNRHNDKYYCIGLVGEKLIFGIRSTDGNYFSTLYTAIRDTYFSECTKRGKGL
ncbi:MAG: hypothetical protein J5829_07155 [Lachnospiraceae bacterium]|nr:hypothetical protein [Lachnospiraceae bacterium]